MRILVVAFIFSSINFRFTPIKAETTSTEMENRDTVYYPSNETATTMDLMFTIPAGGEGDSQLAELWGNELAVTPGNSTPYDEMGFAKSVDVINLANKDYVWTFIFTAPPDSPGNNNMRNGGAAFTLYNDSSFIPNKYSDYGGLAIYRKRHVDNASDKGAEGIKNGVTVEFDNINWSYPLTTKIAWRQDYDAVLTYKEYSPHIAITNPQGISEEDYRIPHDAISILSNPVWNNDDNVIRISWTLTDPGTKSDTSDNIYTLKYEYFQGTTSTLGAPTATGSVDFTYQDILDRFGSEYVNFALSGSTGGAGRKRQSFSAPAVTTYTINYYIQRENGETTEIAVPGISKNPITGSAPIGSIDFGPLPIVDKYVLVPEQNTVVNLVSGTNIINYYYIDEAPIINIENDLILICDETEYNLFKGVTATDDEDITIPSERITVSPETIDTTSPGTHTVTYTAIDSVGNRTTATRNVVVHEKLTVAPLTKTVTEGQEVPASTKVVEANKTFTVASSTVNGLSVDEDGDLIGTPTGIVWGADEEGRIIEIPITVTSNASDKIETLEKTVTVNILRDTDGDGIPDHLDDDDDNDGILDIEDLNPKSFDDLTATPFTKTVVEGQEVPASTKVLKTNKTSIVTSSVVKGLSVDGSGDLIGTPTGFDWGASEEGTVIEIPVTVTSNASGQTETVLKTVLVNVLRDTDGDGTPDYLDNDDDGDGILDEQDLNPKSFDDLMATPLTKTVIEGQEVPASTKVVEANKTFTVASSTVNGLTVDEDGDLIGIPTGIVWVSNEEGTLVEIPITVTSTASGQTETLEKIVIVNILRDTDGDGTPDYLDNDDDGDGILDGEDLNPKSFDGLTATTLTKTVIEGQAVAASTKVVETNKTSTVASSMVNGLSVDESGNLVGTPTGIDWGAMEEGTIVEISLTVTSTASGQTETVQKTVQVNVLRDTDGDGTPDYLDNDDDGDGILDNKDLNPKSFDALTATPLTKTVIEGQVVPASTKVVEANKTFTVASSTVKGLTVDEDGDLTGTPTGIDWGAMEEEKIIEISVTVTSNASGEVETVQKTVEVKVLRDTDGDGTPDTIDLDDDGDGYSDVAEIEAGSNPKDENSIPGTVYNPVQNTEITNQTQTIVEGENISNVVISPPEGATLTRDETNKPNGVTFDEANLTYSGKPVIDNWVLDEETKSFSIIVRVNNQDGSSTTKLIGITVLRDTDRDGTPDYLDNDDDGDGILDEEDSNPKSFDDLTATTITETVIEGQAVAASTKVVETNKTSTVASSMVNGLSVDESGNLVGTPTGIVWVSNEEGTLVEIPVTVTSNASGQTETLQRTVKVNVLRDTDGDGTPDYLDNDDDGDGILDTEDLNPKSFDELTASTITETVIEGQAVAASTKVLKINKTSTIESAVVKGLSIDENGNLVGTPTGFDWGANQEGTIVQISVTVTSTASGQTETVQKTVTVNVLRDTDGDGTPDSMDTDDDGDGILDEVDPNPKSFDDLIVSTITKTVVEGQAVAASTKVLKANKTSVVVSSEVNGLSIDEDGNLVGTPTGFDWGASEEGTIIEIPATVTSNASGQTETLQGIVKVNVLRDTDGDGTPDYSDDDDDGDGILDVEDLNPKSFDDLTATSFIITVTENQLVPASTKIVETNKPSTIASSTVNGLSVDESGNLVGTPTVIAWGVDEEGIIIEIPITVTSTASGQEETLEKTVTVNILRDTDGDGIPDYLDDDDDGDGILDDNDLNPKSFDDLTATTITETVIEGQAVAASTKVLELNKPCRVESDVVKGLSVNENGDLVGTPTGFDWGLVEEERVIEISVTVTSLNSIEVETLKRTVTVNVLRDTDGDGIPDTIDLDDDGDGYPDVGEIEEGSNPKDKNSVPKNKSDLPFTGDRINIAIPISMSIISGLLLLFIALILKEEESEKQYYFKI